MSDTERMREACAKVCEDAAADANHSYGQQSALGVVARRIRALAVPEQAPETPVWVSADALAFLRADETSVNAHVGTRLYRKGREGLVPLYAAPAALPDGKDAERWRWQRAQAEQHGLTAKFNEMEAAIDAAIQAQTEGERAPLQVGEKHETRS